ncbi:hypothetical protein BN946_scf184830.g5 [Trametes cinnabarina]|uniref:Uncharacterized protein n=1 Tax=Pycnoporus cinnabarinus TaxID=5643 RepID=A0A060SEY8_PYCCI|nr:hypothetical protein BN946_scf184830.g5 [Trametes cinnabarina]
MFSKSVIALASVILSISLQAHAHAGVTPALGVAGTFARSDVQRPSTAKPCGNTNIAQTIDSSTAITAAANGTFAATITNFNAGVDGSRQVTAQIDPTGTGKSFTAATVLQNGDKNPTDVGSQQLVVQLPAGTACSGGATGDKCLVSFVTAGGFGNCVVVQSATAGAAAGNGAAAGTAAAGTAAAGTAASGTAAAGTTSAAGTTGTTTTKGKGKKHSKAAKQAATAAAQAKAAQAANAQTANAQAANSQAASAQGLAKAGQHKVKEARDVYAVGSRAARALRRAEEAAQELA